jgi:hypothetical protein
MEGSWNFGGCNFIKYDHLAPVLLIFLCYNLTFWHSADFSQVELKTNWIKNKFVGIHAASQQQHSARWPREYRQWESMDEHQSPQNKTFTVIVSGKTKECFFFLFFWKKNSIWFDWKNISVKKFAAFILRCAKMCQKFKEQQRNKNTYVLPLYVKGCQKMHLLGYLIDFCGWNRHDRNTRRTQEKHRNITDYSHYCVPSSFLQRKKKTEKTVIKERRKGDT